MFDIDQLRATEHECHFSYPAALWAIAAELDEIAAQPVFARLFSEIRTATPHDVYEVRQLGLSDSLIPFMYEPQHDHADYYCCEWRVARSEPRVAVFAVHAEVADWPSFADFAEWIRQELNSRAKPD